MSEHEITNWELIALEFLREAKRRYLRGDFAKAEHYLDLAKRHIETVNEESETAHE